MKELVIKDLKVSFRQTLVFVLFSSLVLLFPYYTGGWLTIYALSGLYVTITAARLTLLERQSRREVLICSLPVSRKQVVGARYISIVITAILTMIIHLGVILLAEIIFPANEEILGFIFDGHLFITYLIVIFCFISILQYTVFAVGSFRGAAAAVWFAAIAFDLVFIFLIFLARKAGINIIEIARQLNIYLYLAAAGVSAMIMIIFSKILAVRAFKLIDIGS